MLNHNPVTGIRYGVIALNNIDQDVANELWYGPGARNISEESAIAEVRAHAQREFEIHCEEAEIAAAESGADREAGFDSEDFLYRYLDSRQLPTDLESYIDNAIEHADIQIEEPTIEGVYEGVKYSISWLGGAPLLWILEGPVGMAERLCNPCVPNAADLDGGYVHGDDGSSYCCYVLPKNWAAEEVPA